MVDGYVGGIYKLLKTDIAYGIYGSEGFSPWKALLGLLIVQLVVVVVSGETRLSEKHVVLS
jgi:hypothetical protein